MMKVGTLNSERLRNKVCHQQNVCVNKQLSVPVMSIIKIVLVVVRIVKIVMAVMSLVNIITNLIKIVIVAVRIVKIVIVVVRIVKTAMAIMSIVIIINIMSITSLLHVGKLHTSNPIINPIAKCL